jgi:hypothetical protein
MATICVALLGSKDDPFRDNEMLGSEAERTRDWDDREKVELEVADDETLSAILSRAGTKLGVKPYDGKSGAPAPTFFAQYSEEGDRQFTGLTPALNLVDDQGRVRWGVMYDGVTYGDLVRATEAQAIAGDPRRLYYCTYPGIGNGVLVTLAQYATAIFVVMNVVSALEGTVSFGERVRDALRTRLGAAKQTLDAHGFDWEQRNGEPHAINAMLGDRPWHPVDLAGLLGCSDEEAQAVLWAFGFAQDEAGLWRRGVDETARVLETLLDEIQLAYSLGHGDFQETVETRARHVLTTGKRAPQPFTDKYEYGDNLALEDVEDYPDFEGEGDDLGDLPLDYLRLECACGKEDCSAVAGFGIANGRLKIGFTAPTDHFVLDPEFAVHVSAQVAEEIEAAKMSGGSDA